ncbi:MAG: nickel pincer cofactor biosynthesis protein LarC [Clostridia bacterium]|nr:nickel pincer cofactor biosynthesis protein LarC [Clostridia bacterium]
MKTLYLDCGMGAAGDMLTAALLELLPDPDAFLEELNAVGIPHVVFEKTTVYKCGIAGTHVSVCVNGVEESALTDAHDRPHGGDHGRYAHASLHSIEHIVGDLAVSERVKADVLAVYRLIAEAEAHVHNCTIDEIHFHEVGTLDAVADVTAVCMLTERLAPEQIIASPVHVGSGTVRCAHGILPVPAPATAYILRDVPILSGEIRSELCTPTGAALLKHFVTSFAMMPLMRVEAIGYGMGSKDFPVANCVRAMIGQAEGDAVETMCELSVNMDDMTAEDIGSATGRIFDAGAVEVYTVPIGMKKNRPSTLIRVICAPEKRKAVLCAIFRHTTTIGVREVETRRYVLSRSMETRQTSLGPVRVKRSAGYGVVREKCEHDDLAKIAGEYGLSVSEVRMRLEREI